MMGYCEFNPQLSVQDVKCIWTLEEPQEIYNRDTVLPDPYVEIVFNYGAPLLWETQPGKWIELPHVIVKGLQSHPLHLRVIGFAQLIGVRLSPVLASSLLDMQACPIAPPASEWQMLLPTLISAIRRNGQTEAVDTLRQFLSEHIQKQHTGTSSVHMAQHHLMSAQGNMRVSDLAACCYLSPSQLERKFKATIGVTPKSFARLVRFEAIRNYLTMNPLHSVVDLASELGYVDQAHLIHEFKLFAQCTPRQYAIRVAQRHDAEFLQSL
jgi:AraC-like DNA-binding protein